VEDAGGGCCPLLRPRVVVADDSPTERAVAGSLLGDLYEVQVLPDGVAALAAIRARLPDVIVSDFQMPGLSGLDLLEEVRSDPESSPIPFILVTSDRDAGLTTMAAGADDYLTKPYSREELRARVAAAVRSRRMYAALELRNAELSEANAESRRLEVELRQAQKLEAVGRLAAGVAHEINTPIQFIGDNTRFLGTAFEGLTAVIEASRRALGAGAPHEAEAAFRTAAAAADLEYLVQEIPKTVAQTLEGVRRVCSIVQAMKEFAHPDRKEMVAADLNRALQATLEVARNEYKYVADVATDLRPLPLVTCHPGDLNQVFLNVIVNAAHAIGEKVKGTDRRGCIRVRTALEGEAAHVAIEDDGPGIPAAIRDRIFDPFFTTKEVGRGTGQGLAIARNIVAKHRGEIWFETEEGRGTTFHLRLPLRGGEQQEAQ
jgi:signal transduction histidine kinase